MASKMIISTSQRSKSIYLVSLKVKYEQNTSKTYIFQSKEF